MATATGSAGYFSGYSSWVAFRTVIDYSISSSNDTSATVKIVVKCKMVDGKDAGFNFTANGTIGGTKSGDSTGSGYYSAGGTYTIISSYTKTISKTHSAQSISVSAKVWDTYMGGSSTVNASISVPAKTSHSVTYNANSGSGAPAAQTKWYGETLALSSTKPTRTNYNFTGWNTKADGTGTNYASGANYTSDDGNVTLYAMWKLAFVAPTITKVTAFRSDSSGTADPSSTSHIHVDVTWKVDTTVTSSNKGKSVAVAIAKGTTSYGSASNTGSAVTSVSSGTTSFTIAAPSGSSFDTNSAFTITATLADSNSQTTKRVAFVSRAVKPFSMANQGLSAGFFGVAKNTLKHVLQIFGGADNDPAIRFYSARGNVQGGAAVPSANTAIASELAYDSTEYNAYYSQLMHNTSDQLYHSYVIQRKNSAGTAYQHGFYMYLNANGKPVLSFTSNNTGNSGSPGAVPYAWHKAISTWKQLATAKSGTAMTFTLPDDCSEVMVAAVCTTTSNSIRVYGGSVVIPRALLSTTNTEWLLSGGSIGSTTSSNGTRYCSVQITTTKATGVGAYSDGTNHASTTTFYVYAR